MVGKYFVGIVSGVVGIFFFKKEYIRFVLFWVFRMTMRLGGFDHSREKLKKWQQANRYGVDSRKRFDEVQSSRERFLKSAPIATLLQQRDGINTELEARAWDKQGNERRRILSFVAHVLKQHVCREHQQQITNEQDNIDSFMSIMKRCQQ